MSVPAAGNEPQQLHAYEPFVYVEPKILHDGSTIEGDLNHGTGIGTRTFASGHVWSGQLKNWFLNGKGEHRFPDGRKLEGEFVNSQLHGRGTITNPDGSIAADGIFENGKLAFIKV